MVKFRPVRTEKLPKREFAKKFSKSKRLKWLKCPVHTEKRPIHVTFFLQIFIVSQQF